MTLRPHSGLRGFASRGNALPTALAIALSLTALPASTSAHLSIIRQGRESAGFPELNDQFGRAVVAGDFNGDGWEDLATGAPQDRISGISGKGSVVINFGSSFGLTHVGAQFLSPTSFLGQTAPQFGSVLESADFNLDGYDDLAVGIPRADTGGFTAAGLVAVYWGSANGFSPTPYSYTQPSLGLANGNNDQFGFSLAAGDLNGDGRPDLAIGIPGKNSSKGAVAWMYSNAGFGFDTPGAEWATQASYGALETIGDQFGYSLAIGQLDGYYVIGGTNPLDLAVGIPFKDSFGSFGGGNVGAVAIFRALGSAGPAPNIADVYTPSTLGLAAATVSNGWFGYSLATGNLFPTGLTELVVGRPGYDISRGQVVVLQGDFELLNYVDSLDSTDFGLAGGNSDFFGIDVACGDWDLDGNDDLVVGSPGDTPPFTSFNDSGRVYLYVSDGVGLAATKHWNQPDLGETTDDDFQLGYSVCFGTFDKTGRANIAAGAPGFGHTGQVHIIAPWRQVEALHCDTSIVFDCDDNIVFSQKPFDPVFLASTTKTMTILLASERAQLPSNHPDYVSLSQVYTVPAWVADNIGGSQFNLVEGEKMTLYNLMAMTMAVSGNDCAYAVADMLTGGNATFVDAFDVVPQFLAEMNAKALQLGMFDTTFPGPAGLSTTTPESTAYDTAILSRAAMKDPIFAGIVGTSNWTITRKIPDLLGGFFVFPVNIGHFFVPILKSILPEGTGLKGGSTPQAQITGFYSARGKNLPWGTAIATTFHTPFGDGDFLIPEGAALLGLGLEACDDGYTYTPNLDKGITDFGKTGIGVGLDKEWITKLPPPDPGGPVSKVQIHSEVPSGQKTRLILEVIRSSDVALDNAKAALYKAQGVTQHKGVSIRSPLGAPPLTLRINTNTVGTQDFSVVMQPGDVFDLPPASLPVAGDFEMLLTSIHGGNLPVTFEVTETYEEVVSVATGLSKPSIYSMEFPRTGANTTEHLFDIKITGLDPTPSHTVGLVMRGDSTTYVHEANPAEVIEYGFGWPGTHGVPTLAVDNPPVLGSTYELQIGNSTLADTIGLWNIGLRPLNLLTTLGGTAFVKPFSLQTIMIPAEGLNIPLGVSADPSFVGFSIYFQVYMVDDFATHEVSFTRALELKVGY